MLNTAAVVSVVDMVSRRQFLFNHYIILIHCFDIYRFRVSVRLRFRALITAAVLVASHTIILYIE